jgi:hypothetical protein
MTLGLALKTRNFTTNLAIIVIIVIYDKAKKQTIVTLRIQNSTGPSLIIAFIMALYEEIEIANNLHFGFALKIIFNLQ